MVIRLHEKMLDINNHQGKANQNHKEISHLLEKKTRNNKCWQGCEKKKPNPNKPPKTCVLLVGI